MLIGILEAELLPEHVSQQFGSYADMFEKLLRSVAPQLQFRRYAADRGQLPQSLEECDGYLITGSRHSAYESLDWIVSLKQFIQQCNTEKRKLLGICFGHQVIAEALGGNVEKSPKGWGIGTAEFSVEENPSWLTGRKQSFSILVTHQDQVMQLPPHAKRFATNDFCLNGGFFISDHIFTLQGHPEFSKAYLQFLLEKRRAIFDPNHLTQSQQAIEEYKQIPELARWLQQFFYYSEHNKY